MLGWSLIAPGQLSRLESLKRAAIPAVKLIFGVVIMLTIAAFIEAFWSSSTVIPITIKYTVAALLWSVIILYFTYSGRRKNNEL
jgi:uncharacterized membrane protein SpoIIM required for sporulation